MNPWLAVIPPALVLVFLIRVFADLLNLSALEEKLPAAFQGRYDPRRYRRSQRYLAANTRFAWVRGAAALAGLLLFWGAGGFGWTDHAIRSRIPGELAAGLVFLGTLALLQSMLNLPFAAWRTFVLEERFGFNRTSPATFAADRIKSALLALAIGAPLAGTILWLFARPGGSAWWICWAVVTVFQLALQFVAPAWILPLFNRLEPLEPGELKTALQAYARRVGLDLRAVFVMDGSRRSGKANAFFTGFGRHRRIVFFDTLVDGLTTDELVAVLAHETGHRRLHHILQGTVLSILHSGAVLYVFSLLLADASLFRAFGFTTPSVHAALAALIVCLGPVDLLLRVPLLALSRRNETAADRFAARTTGRPGDLASALIRLSIANMTNLSPHPFFVRLHHAHPPVLDRLHSLGECTRAIVCKARRSVESTTETRERTTGDTEATEKGTGDRLLGGLRPEGPEKNSRSL